MRRRAFTNSPDEEQTPSRQTHVYLVAKLLHYVFQLIPEVLHPRPRTHAPYTIYVDRPFRTYHTSHSGARCWSV